jgi:hypothetical protein
MIKGFVIKSNDQLWLIKVIRELMYEYGEKCERY